MALTTAWCDLNKRLVANEGHLLEQQKQNMKCSKCLFSVLIHNLNYWIKFLRIFWNAYFFYEYDDFFLKLLIIIFPFIYIFLHVPSKKKSIRLMGNEATTKSSYSPCLMGSRYILPYIAKKIKSNWKWIFLLECYATTSEAHQIKCYITLLTTSHQAETFHISMDESLKDNETVIFVLINDMIRVLPGTCNEKIIQNNNYLFHLDC